MYFNIFKNLKHLSVVTLIIQIIFSHNETV